jgi:UDP-3-O-[3-hydroxymyristoyl] glucosamine N-acyltransferase
MATLSKYFAPPIEDVTLPPAEIGEGSTVSSKAELANGAKIGKNCTIMAHVYVGANAVIGDNTIIYPNVTVYRDCKVGSDCIIHANTTIGSDGFGFATNKLGQHRKIYQNGNVVIEDDVEIGSSTTIDRAVFGTTLIKNGVRIDNLVQVGHNCIIGEYSVLVSQAGISGSTTMGRNVVMGGQSATAGHLEIAPFTTMAARSGVTKSIKKSGLTFAGFPLMEHKLWLKLQAKIARLIK